MFRHIIVVNVVPGPNSLQTGAKSQNFLCDAGGVAKTELRQHVGAQISSTIVESHVLNRPQEPASAKGVDLWWLERDIVDPVGSEVDVTAVTVM